MERPMYGDNTPDTKTARQLQDDRYILVSDSQDVTFWLDFVAFPEEYRADVTACLVDVSDGDLNEIWFTESGAWYDLGAWYHNLAYYLA